MVVLSLFDGISCGQIALEKAGIKVDKYYSSEIDKDAINITQRNYPNTIQLGNVNNWKQWNINWKEIDLLIGGSPCQGFSRAGKKLNFEDSRSKLFFIYVDILNHIKKYNPDVKFLLENVKMKKEWQDIITEYLKTKPVEINSILVSAQNRPRLYWTNFNITMPENKNIQLLNILDNDDFKNKSDVFKEYTNFYIIPRATDNKLINGSYNRIWKINKKSGALSVCNIPKIGYIDNNTLYYRNITINEAERLQTLPINYTSGILNSKRYKAIGNAWTVDIITCIFKSLKDEVY